MEFPALNILFAPFWSLGPHWGRIASVIGITLLASVLLALAISQWSRISAPGWAPRRSRSFWLTLVASFAAGWWGKFIPDLISVLLVLLSVGIALREDQRRWTLSAALGTIGLLMKPTSIVVFFLGACFGWRKLARASCLVPFGIATALAATYYIWGISWLKTLQQGLALFAVDSRDPIAALAEFFGNVPGVATILWNRLFFKMGLAIVLIGIVITRKAIKENALFARLAVILGVQFLVIAALGGNHVFIHDYYFIGLGPTGALLLGTFLETLQKTELAISRWIYGVCLIGITIPMAEQTLVEFSSLSRKRHPSRHEMLQFPQYCSTLQARNPEVPWRTGFIFRSSPSPFPVLGLCMGEREGSTTSEWGFYLKSAAVPDDCEMTDQEGPVVLARCNTGHAL